MIAELDKMGNKAQRAMARTMKVYASHCQETKHLRPQWWRGHSVTPIGFTTEQWSNHNGIVETTRAY